MSTGDVIECCIQVYDDISLNIVTYDMVVVVIDVFDAAFGVDWVSLDAHDVAFILISDSFDAKMLKTNGEFTWKFSFL